MQSRVMTCGVASVVALALSLAAGVPAAWAQGAASSTIHGTVTDETGATLPGVTITLSSPQLQAQQRTTITEADGTYRFTELPGGTYRVSFELTGFRSFVRDELRITIGFTARVDANLAVGGLEEAVTVSGQSPVVDLSNTATRATFTTEVLESVPRGRDFQSVVEMAPGVTREGAPDVGGSQMAQRPSMSTYGVQATPKIQVEGINITTGSDANTAVYFNYAGMEEIQTITSGTSAEVGTPGLHMIAVLKSGSNQFHGQYEASYQGKQTQSTNLTPELIAQGITNTENLNYHYFVAADLGGRIIRDKLWFYGGFSKQHRNGSVLGLVDGPGADGIFLTGDEPIADDYNTVLDQYNAKVSWQLSKNNRIIGVVQQGTKLEPQRDGNRFRPLSATRDYYDPTGIKKLEWQSTINPRMLVNVVGGYGGYFADYNAMRTPEYRGPDFPSLYNRTTGLSTGGHNISDQRPRDNWQLDGSFSYFPDWSAAGRHEFKTGFTYYHYLHGSGTLEHPHGNYRLTYDSAPVAAENLVPELGYARAAEITISNYPTEPKNRVDMHAWYLMDTWRMTNRLTANLGVRLERQNGFVPEQSFPGSSQFPQLFPAGDFARVPVVTWFRALPRMGLAFEINPTTLVKGSFGQYNDLYRDADVGNFNTNALSTITYRWLDPDRNHNYTPGEVNLDRNGPDFISISAATNRATNPDLEQPVTTEATLSLEKEVMANVGVRVGYVFRRRTDLYNFNGVNVLRPRSAYNIPLQRRDPGPDGVLDTADDAGSVTIYDYDPAYRGASFVQMVQVNSDTVERYHTIEAAITKRLSGSWMASASGFAVKNHRWIEQHFQSPNDDPFPLDETWGWGLNFSGVYRFPADIQLAAFVQAKQGVQGQRTHIFRSQDPDGGPPLRQLSTVTLRLEPWGAQTGDTILSTNLRGSKVVRLGGAARMSFDVDVFNLFNSGVPTSIAWQAGPSFGAINEVLSPRIVRFGAKFDF
jgi:Carboxypeptidase regulatory-like domain